MYLLDTNVVSELRRPRPHGGVLAWFAAVAEHRTCIAAPTIGEIQAGIERVRDSDSNKASEIERWLEKVLISSEVLAMNAQTFRMWARLTHRKSRSLDEDAMIAATAIVHNFTVVTRNVGDFEQFGVRVVNPFEHPRSHA